MTDTLLLFREGDIKGAVLEERAVEKNSIDIFRRWIRCRGLQAPASETINTRSKV